METFLKEYKELLDEMEKLENAYQELNKITDKLREQYKQTPTDKLVLQKIKNSEKMYKEFAIKFDRLSKKINQFKSEN